MESHDLEAILKEFRIKLQSKEKSKDTALSEVYTINDTYILRGRARSLDDIAALEKERLLIEKVRPLLSLSLPKLLPVKSGKFFFETEKFLWTLYPLIPGTIICTWFNLELYPKEKLEEIMVLLKRIHTETRGKFKKSDQNTFVENNLKNIFEEVKPLFSKSAQKRIETAFKKVIKRRRDLISENLCFIHDDFQPGNVIFKNERPVGLVDLDWARIGDHLEDASYSIMMFMRIYDKKIFSFDKNRFELLISSYGLEENEKGIFIEYLILFTMYEVSVCKNVNLEKKDLYLEYQLSMLEFFTGEEFGKTMSQSLLITSTGSPS